MKKMFVVLMLLLCGCEPHGSYGIDKNGISHAKDIREMGGFFSVINIEANGETHEYLMFHAPRRSGIAHLPNCKYCKEKELQ